MKPQTLFYFLLIFFIAATGCKKHKRDSPVDQLPPATQEGKNTFGFLLNGQPWKPNGFAGIPNLSLDYDATFQGGVFNISAYKKLSSTPEKLQVLTLYGDSIQTPQKINLPNKNKFGFSFTNDDTNCYYTTFDSSTKIVEGYFDLKVLDKVKHIFAGEFEIKFKREGCQDVEVSRGRFDLSY